MGRSVARLTRALTLLLPLAGAGTAHAQGGAIRVEIAPPIDRVIEGDSGTLAVTVTFYLTLPNNTGPVSVNWTTAPGSATAPDDFVSAAGTIFWPQFNNSPQTRTVFVQNDAIDEWSPTLQKDEVFFVDLSGAVGASGIEKSRASVTILDNDAVEPGVQFLTAVSSPDGTQTRHLLQWRIPPGRTVVTDVHIRWFEGPACTFPTMADSPHGQTNTGTPPGPGAVWNKPFSGLDLARATRCYSVFAVYGGVPTTQVAQIKATPVDNGSIVWRYHSRSANVVPPTVGMDAIYTVDLQGVVHAMQRGAGANAGWWPSGWNPLSVGAPAQSRSAAVPFGGGWRLLLGTDGGGVHAVDGRFGTVLWSSQLPSGGGVQSPPAALLKGFGGNNDMVVVGTNAGPANSVYALDLQNGATQASFLVGAIDDIRGMAVVDYANNRAYFATAGASPNPSLFAFDLGPPGSPDIELTSSGVLSWNPKPLGAGTSGSPVLRSGRIYVGDGVDRLFALHIAGGASYDMATGNGPVKGFVWPDRRNDNLYFATNSQVHAVRDTGTGFAAPFPWSPKPVASPSSVLQMPGTDFLYVGEGGGRLVEINVADGSEKAIVLEGAGVQIGAPSLDGANGILVVGSATGTIHAVRVPLP